MMVEYIFDHYDPEDTRFRKIKYGVEAKQEAMDRHNVYTAYKMNADLEIKEIARQIYLDKAGIHPDFRW